MGEEINIRRNTVKSCLANRSLQKERQVPEVSAHDTFLISLLQWSGGGIVREEYELVFEKPKQLLLQVASEERKRTYLFQKKDIDIFVFLPQSGKLPPVTSTISATFQLGAEMAYFWPCACILFFKSPVL